MSRVVVTGLGVVSPLGVGTRYCWNQLLKGACGVTRLTGPGFDQLPSKVAARVPEGTAEHQFNKDSFPASEWRQMSKFTAFALLAAQEALTDAHWKPENDQQKDETGVAVGTGMIDVEDVCKTGEELRSEGYRKVSPYFVPRILPNMAAGKIGIKYNLRGPNHAVSTACATGAHSIGDAFVAIRRRQAKVMIAGGSEASISPLSVAGFCRLRALSTNFGNDPAQSSRPFDSKRDGFVMGEGAAVLILEDLEHALARNAPTIYAEVLGYGLSGDGYHLTSPDKNGRGAYLCMKRAIEEAGVSKVHYINAHATSTPLGDQIECSAIRDFFGPENCQNLLISSTKGATGHLLGAAGSLEAAFTVLALKHGVIPATLNLQQTDINCGLNLVSNEPTSWPTFDNGKRIALTNSFGFGGTNASLCFSSFNDP